MIEQKGFEYGWTYAGYEEELTSRDLLEATNEKTLKRSWNGNDVWRFN